MFLFPISPETFSSKHTNTHTLCLSHTLTHSLPLSITHTRSQSIFLSSLQTLIHLVPEYVDCKAMAFEDFSQVEGERWKRTLEMKFQELRANKHWETENRGSGFKFWAKKPLELELNSNWRLLKKIYCSYLFSSERNWKLILTEICQNRIDGDEERIRSEIMSMGSN